MDRVCIYGTAIRESVTVYITQERRGGILRSGFLVAFALVVRPTFSHTYIYLSLPPPSHHPSSLPPSIFFSSLSPSPPPPSFNIHPFTSPSPPPPPTKIPPPDRSTAPPPTTELTPKSCFRWIRACWFNACMCCCCCCCCCCFGWKG